MKHFLGLALLLLAFTAPAQTFPGANEVPELMAKLRPPLSTIEQRMVLKAVPYVAGLHATTKNIWPEMEYPASLAAQIEKESLWDPKAALCIPKGTCAREYGFGFGQFTITPKFNAMEETKALHPSLKDWKYEDRFNVEKQMIGLVVKDRLHYRQCSKLMNPGLDTYSCAFSAYNGGFGGVMADRRLCANTSGCNPQVWFKNVETQSTKAKEPLPGYGQSFYQINRGYVRALIIERPRKYSIFPGYENLPKP
jgi:hypothetical protein